MRFSFSALAILLCITATKTDAAGVRFFDVPASTTEHGLSGAVWYPCAIPSQETTIRELTITGTKDCAIVGENLPLVVLSHGRGGWFGANHDTAAALADAGFIVAAISHPGDSWLDHSREDYLSVLVERPADIKRLTDFMIGSWPDAAKIDPTRIGLFGLSMGGYAGLVVIGGNPDFRSDVPGCKGSDFLACEQLRNNEIPAKPTVHDPRVKAAVIVDPGPSIFFPADNLKAITIPVQLWSSDPKLSTNYVSGCCAIGINRRLPSKPDYHLVPNAIHFSFLAPCSAAEVRNFPRICTDAPGFDRAAFHNEFNADVIAFFQKRLIEDQKP